MARVADLCLQGSIVGQQEQTFGVPVQTPGRVKALVGHEVGQRAASLAVRELGQDIIGFVEEYQLRHAGSACCQVMGLWPFPALLRAYRHRMAAILTKPRLL